MESRLRLGVVNLRPEDDDPPPSAAAARGEEAPLEEDLEKGRSWLLMVVSMGCRRRGAREEGRGKV